MVIRKLDHKKEIHYNSDEQIDSPYHAFSAYNKCIFLKTILIVISLIVVLIASTQIFGAPTFHRNWSTYVSLIFFIWAVFYILSVYFYFGTLYLFSNVYILMLCLFHLGITVPHAFGVVSSSDVIFGLLRDSLSWSSGLYAKWIERSGWYTLIALGSFGIGIALSFRAKNIESFSKLEEQATRAKNLSKVSWDAIGLLFASGIFFLLALKSFGNLLSYSRVDFFRGAGDTRGLGVFLMVFPSAVVLLVIGRAKAAARLPVFVFAASSLLFLLLSGYRSAALFPFLVGTIIWVKTQRKIPPVLALGLVAMVVFAIPVIGVLRTVKYSDIEKGTVTEAVEESKIMDGFRTMGQTAGVLSHILRLVPHKDPYRYGSTYMQALASSIPNIMPQMQKSERREAKRRSFAKPEEIRRLKPADWLTYRIHPDRFKRGEGVGFSAIGEPYMNFGPAGVVIFFVLLGYGLGRLDGVNLIRYPNLIVACAALYWPLVRTVRNDIVNFIKPAIFTIICILIWRFSTGLFVNLFSKQSEKRV